MTKFKFFLIGRVMFQNKLFEPTGFIIAAASFLFSLILFYRDNNSFFGSAFAALMAAALFWATYILLRLIILAFRH